jgi:hypothetical protein
VGARIASAARNDRCSRLLPDRPHHGIDRSAVADVASDGRDLGPEFAARFGRDLLQQFQTSPANDQFGTEFGEPAAHRGAEPGTSAGDQDTFLLEQTLFKHSLIPPHCIVACRQIRHEAFSPCASENQVCP